MRRTRRRPVSEAEFRNFKATMAAAKARERQRSAAVTAPVVYHDTLLRRTLVVEHGGQWWLVPRRPDGWASRVALTMTPEARAERLRPARDVTADWLGIADATERIVHPRTPALGHRDS